MQIKNRLGQEKVFEIWCKVADLLEAESGFIIIGNGDKSRITDMYIDVCKDCAVKAMARSIKEADDEGVFIPHKEE